MQHSSKTVLNSNILCMCSELYHTSQLVWSFTPKRSRIRLVGWFCYDPTALVGLAGQIDWLWFVVTFKTLCPFLQCHFPPDPGLTLVC